MKPNIEYPYLPEGRTFDFVCLDNQFMKEAARARKECAGDSLFPVGIVLVSEGKIIARAGNGYNQGAGKVHVCPRVVLDCPSGTGYDLCHLHDFPGHAEQMVIKTAKEEGIDTNGTDVYMYGHWWCCEPCWNAMIDAGINEVYVTDDAHERFSRENVFAETLKSSVKSFSIQGDLADFKKNLEEALNIPCVISNADINIVCENDTYRIFDERILEYVYEFSESDPYLVKRNIVNIFKQL